MTPLKEDDPRPQRVPQYPAVGRRLPAKTNEGLATKVIAKDVEMVASYRSPKESGAQPAFLYVEKGPGQGQLMPVKQGALVIGRASSTDLRIQHPSISRRHAVVNRRGERFFIKDLGSQNGTWLNRTRVEGEVEFTANDQITLGQTQLRLRSSGQLPEMTAVSAPGEAPGRDGARMVKVAAFTLAVGMGLAGVVVFALVSMNRGPSFEELPTAEQAAPMEEPAPVAPVREEAAAAELEQPAVARTESAPRRVETAAPPTSKHTERNEARPEPAEEKEPPRAAPAPAPAAPAPAPAAPAPAPAAPAPAPAAPAPRGAPIPQQGPLDLTEIDSDEAHEEAPPPAPAAPLKVEAAKPTPTPTKAPTATKSAVDAAFDAPPPAAPAKSTTSGKRRYWLEPPVFKAYIRGNLAEAVQLSKTQGDADVSALLTRIYLAYSAGKNAMDRQDDKTALTQFATALELDESLGIKKSPYRVELKKQLSGLHTLNGFRALEAKDSAEAKRAFSEAVALDPNNSRAKVQLGRLGGVTVPAKATSIDDAFGEEPTDPAPESEAAEDIDAAFGD